MMSKPKQKILWIALPNGISERHLRLSVFVAPQLTNPEGVPKLPLNDDTYPDFVDWPRTLEHVRFNVEFEGLGVLSESGTTLDQESRGDFIVRRRRPRPMDFIRRPWKEVFATAEGAKLQPIVRSFDTGTLPSNIGVIPFSSREVTDIVRNQYALLLETTKPDAAAVGVNPPGVPVAPPPPQSAAQLPPPPPEVSRTIHELSQPVQPFVEKFKETFKPLGDMPQLFSDIEARLDAISAGQSVPPVTVPADGKPNDSWTLALSYYYHRALSLRPTRSRAADTATAYAKASARLANKREIEFHETAAAAAGHPLLMRHLGLVVDLEIRMPNNWAARNAPQVRVIPTWTPSTKVDNEDVTPWTAYTASFLARPKDEKSDLHQGYLHLQARDEEKMRFQLEQIDALNEALKLVGYALAVQHETSTPTEIFSSPRGGGLALVRGQLHKKFIERRERALSLKAAFTSKKYDSMPLHADDLVRGYRMDIERKGKWYSLSSRYGTYNFIAKDEEEDLGPDEGWVAPSAVEVGNVAQTRDRLAMHDIVCKWEGWSLVAPRPGKPIESTSLATRGPDSLNEQVTFTADFVPQRRTLPALRYGEGYRVRVRVVDLAGNSVPIDDPIGNAWQVIAGIPPNVSGMPPDYPRPLPYLRFDPVPAPDVVPRVVPDEAHGEGVFTLVIRSNYNTPCTESTERHLAPPKASETLAESHGFLDEKGRPNDDKYSTLKKYDGEAPPIEPDDEYRVPYLPDPLATGARLQDVPGASSSVILNFALAPKKWPKVKPWRIRLVDWTQDFSNVPPSPRPPYVDEKEGELTIFLPKAEVATLSINCVLTAGNLELMALWDFIKTTFSTNSDLFKAQILNASHWMFNPLREVRLIHAVQQPLFPPLFNCETKAEATNEQCLRVTRNAGDTHALLLASMTMPGKSARSYEVAGSWIEYLDQPDTFETVPAGSIAFSEELLQKDDSLNVSGRHEFGDTKHRWVTYKVIAKTRFREFLKITDEQISSGEKPITRESRPARVSIPNSAVPPTPEVLYVVPTFGWHPQERNATTVSRYRGGGGLRIYINKKWFQTGEDELLGVIVSAYTQNPPLDTLISRWGHDPLSKLPGPLNPLAASDFKGGVRQQNFNWDGAGGDVTVIGYPVTYDKQRNLWFCDVEIDPGETYFPFVRLALTRYQPYSVRPTETNPTNYFLSPVVLSDFCQLIPERRASVVIDPNGPGHVSNIRLEGKGQVPENKVEVVIERSNREYNGEISWQRVGDPQLMQFEQERTESHWILDNLSIPFGSGPLRVLILESEIHPEDTPDDINATPRPTSRIVYAAVVNL